MKFKEETMEEKAKKILAKIVKSGRVATNDQMSFIVLQCDLFNFKMFKRRGRNDKIQKNVKTKSKTASLAN